MIYIDLSTFLTYSEAYVNMAKNGNIVYICFQDGTELKLTKC